MEGKNLAAVLKSVNELVLEDVAVPVPKAGELLIRVNSVGICGSDVHYWQHGRIGDFVVKAPMILGHESSGTVVGIGDRVKGFQIGDRVAIEPGVPCKSCEFCLGGRYNLCPDVQFLATPPVHGNLANFHAHDASFCFKLPESVSFEEGALLEPLSVGVHACRRAGVTLGSVVLICGAGPIGLVNLLVAKFMGASKVAITDLEQSRLDMAKQLGADYSFQVEKNVGPKQMAEKIQEEMGAAPSITIECSGAEPSIQTALYATKSGGMIVLVGLGKEFVDLPIVDAAVREVDIRGIFRYVNCYPAALALVASGKVNVKPLITHHFTLKDSLKAFQTAADPKTGAVKVMINCSDQ